MTQQWMRSCKITWPGGTFTLDKPNENLRVRFTLSCWTSSTPNVLKVIITNPNPKFRTQMKDWRNKTISVEAGYNGNSGPIFTGQIMQGFYGRETPTDTWLVMTAGSEVFAHGFAVVNKTFPRGSTPQDHVEAAVAAMNKISPLKIGHIGPDLTKLKYPRAVTLFKSATSILADVAKTFGANHSTHSGQLHILTDTQTVPGGTIKLNSQTGLIGMPSQTMSGIKARCLINPNIFINSEVEIDQQSISPAIDQIQHGPTTEGSTSKMPEIAADGKYKVIQLDCDADTRNVPWYFDLTLLATSGQNVGTASLVASGAASSSGNPAPWSPK